MRTTSILLKIFICSNIDFHLEIKPKHIDEAPKEMEADTKSKASLC